MLTRLSILFCVLCAIVLMACAKTEVTTNSNTATLANANKAAAAPTTAPVAASSGEKIGVPECDAYIAAYENCVSGKIPEVARAQYKTSLDQLRASWRKLADNPQTKPSLAAACKTASTQAAAAMKTYGCTF